MKKSNFYRTHRRLSASNSRRRITLKRNHQSMLQRRKMFNLFNFEALKTEI
ncbi:MAG: hypothetical protein ABF253_08665 [Glaciecola sp.]|jgi:hypothetical protein